MLETVREFALEQLAASGEDDETRQRQASWCLALMEVANRDLKTGRAHTSWLARLDAELDNLRAALAWFNAADEPINVLRLLALLGTGIGPSGPTTTRFVAGWSQRCAPLPMLPQPFAWGPSPLSPLPLASSATRRRPSPMPRKGWRSPESLATRLPSAAPFTPSARPGRR